MQSVYADMLAKVSQHFVTFNEGVVSQVCNACEEALKELDQRLVGIRDGIVSDEAAESRNKVSKCAAKRTLPP